jgi:uncharacterized protein YqjF (DUF2071 family)
MTRQSVHTMSDLDLTHDMRPGLPVGSRRKKRTVFLRADWRYLVMLNFVIDSEVLNSLIPSGTELDFYEGKTYVSLVGFRFLRTRVLGVVVPFLGDFDEINLRFYVKRRTEDGWRRGVVFVREFVPRRAVAYIARFCYGEPYCAVPMRHEVKHDNDGVSVRYEWKAAGQWNSLVATGTGRPSGAVVGSLEEFITEHYWGYTKRGERSSEYEVEHQRWSVWKADGASLDCNVVEVYGKQFESALTSQPCSALIADGSPVAVRVSRM